MENSDENVQIVFFLSVELPFLKRRTILEAENSVSASVVGESAPDVGDLVAVSSHADFAGLRGQSIVSCLFRDQLLSLLVQNRLPLLLVGDFRHLQNTTVITSLGGVSLSNKFIIPGICWLQSGFLPSETHI